MGKKWVLITGALGGIGKALVNKFSQEGYAVIAGDIKKMEKALPRNVTYLPLDLMKIANDERYAKQIYHEVAQITGPQGVVCLINNAAVQILNSSAELTRAQWDTSFDVNTKAPFFLTQLLVSDLIKNKGSVVNISSIHATQTKRNFVAYATTKAALSALTQNMVLDLGDKIRINAIEPAAIETDMLVSGFEGKTSEYQRLKDYHPIKRVGRTDEVANLAFFLASNNAEFVQGACISASGGIRNCLSDPSF